MKSKMRKKLIAFMLCMVLVICNSVSILADAPAAATTTTEKQVKETGTAKSEGESEEEKSADDEKDTSEQFDEESAPETKTTEKKEETTEATTEKKEESTTEATTKAKEETTTAEKKETTTAEEGKETSEASDKKSTEEEKSTETKDEENAVTELTYENDDVIVTVSEVAEGAIPEGAELKVVPILKDDAETQEQYTEVEQKIQEKAAETETEIKGFLAYDITFVDEDGNEIEPNSEVKVSMEYKQAAIPAELSEEDAKNTEVSVMHLEEDADGNVSQVVDMGEAGKVDTLETTDAKQVEKVEVKTESFSVFTITWQYGWRDSQKLTVRAKYVYIDDDGNVQEFSDDLIKEDNVEISTGKKVDLTKYQHPTIDNYTYVKTVIGEDASSGIAITKLWAHSKKEGWISPQTYYYIDYLEEGETDRDENYTSWLGTKGGLQESGTILFVYEETSDLKINDNIIENGTLDAEYKGDATVTKYTWYKLNSETGKYEEVKKVNYEGDVSNLSDNGQSLFPAYDKGARATYKVEVTLADGTLVESKPFQVPYYDELQNGSFETPAYRKFNTFVGENTPVTMTQTSNEDYKNAGGVWQTTGEDQGKDIEILGVGEIVKKDYWGNETDGLSEYYSWESGQKPEAADGVQFAELNCETAGALYQDVLTVPGTPLNYALSHRARGNKNTITEYDTMFLVIMPTKDSQDLITQQDLKGELSRLNIDIDGYSNNEEDNAIVYPEKDGVLVVKITSDDQDWHDIVEMSGYTPTSSMTRFFFVAGNTATGDNTVGNFLDDVWFSQDLPEVSDGEFSLQINKKFEGIGESDRQKVEEQLQFQITAKNNTTGEDLTPDEIEQLFGKEFVTGQDSDVIHNADGSLTWNIAYRTIDNNANYTVTLVEQNAGLSGYNVITQADNRVVTGGGESTGENATFTLTSGTTAYVNFTNTYERNENKTVNFTKVWCCLAH